MIAFLQEWSYDILPEYEDDEDALDFEALGGEGLPRTDSEET